MSPLFTSLSRLQDNEHKPSVEGTVGNVATDIITSLRNEVCYSLQSLQMAIREKLDEFNRNPFQKRKYSCWEVF